MKEILPQLINEDVSYTGADIVPALIEKHRAEFQSSALKFEVLDLTRSAIPKNDLIFTRDCFIHLSFKNILSILRNYKKSSSKYLLVSTYTNPERKNQDVHGFYLYGRMLNLQKFPFYFAEPIELIVEGCTEGDGVEYADKSLGLWKIADLNLFKMQCCIFLAKISYLFGAKKLKDKM